MRRQILHIFALLCIHPVTLFFPQYQLPKRMPGCGGVAPAGNKEPRCLSIAPPPGGGGEENRKKKAKLMARDKDSLTEWQRK